ncbi:MAG: carbamoyl phosphate synthase large subunit, partial [Paraglaciecola sp.]|nr:carbamoyl phosphate synthase large subunit [Paraglaciecola sp.]
QNMLAKGFTLEATSGTAAVLNKAGVPCSVVNKLSEGRPNIVDAIKNREYCYIINTTEGRQAIEDSVYIRREALLNKVSYTTTMNAAFATVNANKAEDRARVTSVQALHKRINL